MKKKFALIVMLIVIVITALSIVDTRTDAKNLNLLDKSFNNLNDTAKNIEYIKMISKDGSYEEHWRDISNRLDRADRYDKEGKLESRSLVLESGRKVINIGEENGVSNIYTWNMPNNIASENSKILNQSILEDIKNQVQSEKWSTNNKLQNKKNKLPSIALIEDSSLEKYSTDNIDIFIDKNTGDIKAKVIYQNKEVFSIEEYKKFTDNTKKLFELPKGIDKINIKEIKAPVAAKEF